MSDWQPPPNPLGPPGGPGQQPPAGGFAPPGPPPGPGYGPPPTGGPPPPPPPGQGYGYPQQGGYPPGGAPAYGGPPFAGFGARLGAFLIDGLITAVIPVIAFIALGAGPKGGVHSCSVNGESTFCRSPGGVSIALFSLLMLASLAFGVYYYVILLGRTGQTIGRKAVGIKVVDKFTGQPIGPGRAFIRILVRSLASGLICGLGYWWMLWDAEKQTWHDKVANSYVITT